MREFPRAYDFGSCACARVPREQARGAAQLESLKATGRIDAGAINVDAKAMVLLVVLVGVRRREGVALNELRRAAGFADQHAEKALSVRPWIFEHAPQRFQAAGEAEGRVFCTDDARHPFRRRRGRVSGPQGSRMRGARSSARSVCCAGVRSRTVRAMPRRGMYSMRTARLARARSARCSSVASASSSLRTRCSSRRMRPVMTRRRLRVSRVSAAIVAGAPMASMARAKLARVRCQSGSAMRDDVVMRGIVGAFRPGRISSREMVCFQALSARSAWIDACFILAFVRGFASIVRTPEEEGRTEGGLLNCVSPQIERRLNSSAMRAHPGAHPSSSRASASGLRCRRSAGADARQAGRDGVRGR